LTGTFVSHPPELQALVSYDNHSKINDNRDEVEAKFAAEEEKSFHIILPSSSFSSSWAPPEPSSMGRAQGQGAHLCGLHQRPR
jgi:hypothetical protein